MLTKESKKVGKRKQKWHVTRAKARKALAFLRESKEDYVRNADVYKRVISPTSIDRKKLKKIIEEVGFYYHLIGLRGYFIRGVKEVPSFQLVSYLGGEDREIGIQKLAKEILGKWATYVKIPQKRRPPGEFAKELLRISLKKKLRYRSLQYKRDVLEAVERIKARRAA